jgi:thiol-disulfide isomerase/thioredoxin
MNLLRSLFLGCLLLLLVGGVYGCATAEHTQGADERASTHGGGGVVGDTQGRVNGYELELVLQNLHGKTITFSEQYKGQVVLLQFWATWCYPCHYAVPGLNRMHLALQERGFSVVGITMDMQPEILVPEFINSYKVLYDILIADEAIRHNETPFGYLQGIPAYVLIDRKGRYRTGWLGKVDIAKIESAVKEVLNQDG